MRSREMKNLEAEANRIESKIENLTNIRIETINDYKRANKHRHEHKKGMTDSHTKHQTINNHIEGIERIMKSIIKDIKEIDNYINGLQSKLNCIYGNMDAEEDLIYDAEISYRKVMQELKECY